MINQEAVEKLIFLYLGNGKVRNAVDEVWDKTDDRGRWRE